MADNRPPMGARPWLTTREVRAILGGVSQQYVSRLARSGAFASDLDDEGRRRYDRISVESFAAVRAARKAGDGDFDTKRAQHAEAAERLARDRRRRAQEAEARQRRADELYERAVTALERIARTIGGRL